MQVRFKLDIGQRSIDAGVNLPEAPLRAAELLPVLLALDDAVVEAVSDQAKEQGIAISCRAGCGACCRQLVPLSEAEAFYLARLSAAMPADRRAAVEARFQAAIESLDRRGLLERLKNPDNEDPVKLGEEYFACGIPCPFLEDEHCAIYPQRPTRCREYLVSSPAIHCALPSPEAVRRVPLPAHLSEVLYRFRGARRTVPLVLALEWSAAHDEEVGPAAPAPELFRGILAGLAEPA